MQIGPFRELRMTKTAPHGIKDDNDTRHVELRMRLTRAMWKIKDDSNTRHVEIRMRMTRATWKIKDDSDTRHAEFRNGEAQSWLQRLRDFHYVRSD